ncbi:hypothetical protein SLE2022_210890 [Rubroshorea leprosula]
MQLFLSSLVYSFHDSFADLGVNSSDSLDLFGLEDILDVQEIKDAIFCLKPFKSPRPGGLHPVFFQKLWESIKEIVCVDITQAFSSASIPTDWNDCVISLIPKTKSLETVQQFRPIGLCNTTYKIISKILVNRMKPLLGSLISPCQASFVPSRQGTDNVIILQELVYSFSKKKGQKGDMISKLDLEKVDDRLKWSFIRETLLFFKFPANIISLIMSSVSSTKISILVNGDRTKSFTPSRGIRQGDPISSYIFILCMEYLSIKLFTGMASGMWKDTKAGKSNPTLSHLFFADDLIFVGKAYRENCQYLNKVLDFFCERSVQKINKEKSRILFSRNVDPNTRGSLSSLLGFRYTNDLGKYLVIPISAKKASKYNCNFILHKIRAKLSGWKSIFFSMAGRTTLVSFVLSSIPNFYMQAMWLQSSAQKEIDCISRNFIWGSIDGEKKIHLINWDTICQPHSLGGLGLRSAKDANLVAMSKLNWRLHTEKRKVWKEDLVQKYKISGLNLIFLFLDL